MSYFCGIISCKQKCFGYPHDCRNCKEGEYTSAGAPNVVTFRDLPKEDEE